MPPISHRVFGVATAALLGGILFAAPASVQAQQSAPMQAAPAAPAKTMPPATAKKPRASRTDRVETRIKTLHAQLKITPAEEQEWSAVAQTMRDTAKNIDQLAQTRNAGRASMTAVDNLKSYQAIADAHADEMNKLVPAFEALYAKMPDAQKKVADQVFSHRQARHRAKAKS